jgi:hypothetical protein
VTGDGVNDAGPPTPTSPLRWAADRGGKGGGRPGLGDDSFVTLLYGLGEGRRLVDRIQKGLVFLISAQ